MKIDIHVHTKKIKKGDSHNRNVSAERFEDIIKSTDVKILAITNHNHFDLKQYLEFSEKVKEDCQVWPGVELDIKEGKKTNHLIIIVNPKNASELSEKMDRILNDRTPDKFNITIDEVVKEFDSLDSIYIAHYYNKTPSLSDEAIAELETKINSKTRIIKEATNSISAGIFVSHGHNAIYGSDIQDWDEYCERSKDLPELKLPVESFEQFCLLLSKDEPTINTMLNKKKCEYIKIKPFTTDEIIQLKLYNDINIFFGSKGTGKSDILKAISNHYNELGLQTSVFESNMENIDEYYDIKGTKLKVSLSDYKIDTCINEISFLKSAIDENVTSISKYRDYFLSEITNTSAKQLKIKDFNRDDVTTLERKFQESDTSNKKIISFIEFVETDKMFQIPKFLEVTKNLQEALQNTVKLIQLEVSDRFIKSKTAYLFNNLIDTTKEQLSKKIGVPLKPSTTWFQNYASNRIKIENNAKKIKSNIEKSIHIKNLEVGDLGEKGKLFFSTQILIQDGNNSDSSFITYKNINKKPLKEFSKVIFDIEKNIYKKDLFEKINKLNSIESIDLINEIDDLLLFKREFILNDTAYKPSSGEASMLLLQNELKQDKDVYLLDEPEKSLGNDYINDVIVPLLKERAKQGKRIIIVTHDANIAVRTLPYNSIYRNHQNNLYTTYSGNPFSNNLVNLDDSSEYLDWKEISMKTLEGGRDAFGERGKIYGK